MEDHAGASGEFARGVDITGAHGALDWKAASDAGVTFGYIVVSRGTPEESRHLETNWRQMKEAGILRGACHYFQPLKDAEEQARYFAEIVESLGDPDLPPAVRVKAVPTLTGLNEWDGLHKDRR